MNDHRMEILAPAGDMEMLRAAVYSGADCVYLGVRGFNARHGAANFGGQELIDAVGFCHARNCRVYAAINTLALPGREAELRDAVLQAAGAGCDAVIVQDLYAAALARAVRPALEVHASTQMSVHSLEGVRQLAALGFSRAILARELSFDEIAAIAESSPIELEVFVHGALCVSVSGQCYASAFLGGRSANRGACAGTCRLPFAAQPQTPAQLAALLENPAAPKARAATTCHLSLKDLSILDALPALEKLGVCSAKIEGRLRGPEYCAVVVDSARKAINKEEYDKDLLLNVFSRSGFTDGWFTGENGGDMFGARSGADADATRKALPKARELYRRERPRVPVEMALTAGEAGGELVVTDGADTVRVALPGPLAPAAAQDGEDRLRVALEKTGGTPFYLAKPPAVQTGGVHLPAPQVSGARREALDALLALRQAPPPPATLPAGFAVAPATGAGGQKARQAATAARAARGRMPLRARFEHVAQMPEGAARLCETLILPLFEAEQVSESLRPKTLLWLPRVLFGPAEERAAQALEKTKVMGFAGYEANNLAHLHLLRGLPVSGGFGLNAANAGAAAILAGLGCAALTLSPELSLPQMRQLAADPLLAAAPATDALCYGHLPLFLTRACPLKQVTDCARCQKAGLLRDRKGAAFPLLCRDGARSALNPVPLWMADELDSLPTDTATLYFTAESQKQAAAVLEGFHQGRPAVGPFTRGLYPKGSRQQA